MSTAGGLNPKQKLFIAEYLKDLCRNGKQAAIRAGYSPKTAEVQASRLLRVAKVRAAVEAGKQRIATKLDISAERIREELALIGFSDMADHVTVGEAGEVRVKPFTEMPEGSSRVVSGIKEKKRILSTESGDTILESTLEYKHYDKVKALELLAKDLGMLKDKVEHSGTIDIKGIEVTFVKSADKS